MKLKDLVEEYGDYEVQESFLDLLKKSQKTESIWDLREGDKYYLVRDSRQYTWHSSAFEIKCRKYGDVFLTEEEASYETKRREIYTKVKKYSYEFSEEEWKNNLIPKFYPSYDYSSGKVENWIHNTDKEGCLYFRCGGDINRAVEEVGEKDFIRYYLGVKNE